jgi:hypothetical protein
LALFMSVPAPRSYGVVWRVGEFTCLRGEGLLTDRCID